MSGCSAAARGFSLLIESSRGANRRGHPPLACGEVPAICGSQAVLRPGLGPIAVAVPPTMRMLTLHFDILRVRYAGPLQLAASSMLQWVNETHEPVGALS